MKMPLPIFSRVAKRDLVFFFFDRKVIKDNDVIWTSLSLKARIKAKGGMQKSGMVTREEKTKTKRFIHLMQLSSQSSLSIFVLRTFIPEANAAVNLPLALRY